MKNYSFIILTAIACLSALPSYAQTAPSSTAQTLPPPIESPEPKQSELTIDKPQPAPQPERSKPTSDKQQPAPEPDKCASVDR